MQSSATARLTLVSIALVSAAALQPARAQESARADVIRGTVTNDSAGPIPGATVIITRGPDRLVQQVLTDSAGRYAVRFDSGTGDYLVYVTLPPYKSARRRVQRQDTERELVADFVLARDVATLAAVQVRANRPTRASNTTSPTTPEAASERWIDGVQGQLPPSAAGDLGAIAGTMPGVTLTPGGPTILGAGAESNLTTLNGTSIAAGQMPRAARLETRVTGATYDATRGGFSGANIDVRLGAGSRHFQRRNAYFTVDPAALQFTDRAGHALGTRSNAFRASAGADGEIIRQAMTYNVAVDASRSAGDATTLFDADREALLRAGVSPDSVARLALVSAPLGLPASAFDGPRERTSLTWLGRIDDTRDSLDTRALTTYVGITRDGAIGFGPLSARTTGGDRVDRTAGAQLLLRSFVGEQRRVLVDTRLGGSYERQEVSPFAKLPGATVLVRSDVADQALADVAGVSLGGGPFLAANDTRWNGEGTSEVVWNARGSRHRFKAHVFGRFDGMHEGAFTNALGTYRFNSIEDFAAGRAASFTRTLEQPARAGRVWNAAGAFVHNWVPSRWFNLIYGARVEGNGFADTPASNPQLDRDLAVRTGLAPTLLHASPRLGFSFSYNRDRDNGEGLSMNQVGTFFRPRAGVIRGGVGEFRDLLRPGLLADALASTGLPGATTMLSCVGDAVPTPDWSRFAADPATIPTQCTDASGVLTEHAPFVTLIDEGYDLPRSWRASLDWNTTVGKWVVRAGALGSYDLNQPGTFDANFSGQRRYALAAESDRPVFVSPAAIDPATGAVSPTEARVTGDFGRVAVRRSDLRGYGGQLTFGVAPDAFKFRSRYQLFWSTGYTLQQMRRQYRGFDGGGFGDPREREWAPNANDARHIVVLSGGVNSGRTGTITLFGRLQSGLPFTPIVQGDVNGDGRTGDRAHIPSFSAADGELSAALRALRADGADAAAGCLARFEGRVAARNGCRGPWTQTLNMQWRPPIPHKWMGRVTANVYLQNVLGGVDQLVNGSDLRGWGSPAQPDPVLLIPRGFDAGTGTFRYDVNPRFAETRPTRTSFRAPFKLSIDFNIDLSTNYDLQQLRRALEPVRGADRRWTRRGADSITAFYLGRTSSIHGALLEESDSLFLSNEQIARLQLADSIYSAQVRGIYIPLGEYLASTGGAPPGQAQLDSVTAVQKAYWKIFWQQPEVADSILTPLQKSLMPSLVQMLSVPAAGRETSRWYIGSSVTLRHAPRARARR